MPSKSTDRRSALCEVHHQDVRYERIGFIKGKLLGSEDLQVQARNNSEAQFASSPTLREQLVDAIIDSEASFETMSRQALASEKVREGLLEILLGPGQLYKALRAAQEAGKPAAGRAV